MFQIKLNGNLYKTHSQNISSLVEELNIGGKRFAVLQNQSLVTKDNYHTTPLQNDDQIEIIHAIGGG